MRNHALLVSNFDRRYRLGLQLAELIEAVPTGCAQCCWHRAFSVSCDWRATQDADQYGDARGAPSRHSRAGPGAFPGYCGCAM